MQLFQQTRGEHLASPHTTAHSCSLLSTSLKEQLQLSRINRSYAGFLFSLMSENKSASIIRQSLLLSDCIQRSEDNFQALFQGPPTQTTQRATHPLFGKCQLGIYGLGILESFHRPLSNKVPIGRNSNITAKILNFRWN